MFYFHPYLGKIPILTNIFQMGWNHQPVNHKKRNPFLFVGDFFNEVMRMLPYPFTMVSEQ